MATIFGISLIVLALSSGAWAYAQSARPLAVKTIHVGKTAFMVEIADTFMSRGKGLSGHAPLRVKQGMLFIFSSPSAGAFWMQGMTFPIDFVWIHKGAVVGVTENARPMSETGYKLYYPPVPVDRVLELNAGAVKKFGIKIGAKVY
ncbi:MAG: DUF192 domain-containing protein [bacterium]|nr:DUF192 domain-containing protein [bacterium]